MGGQFEVKDGVTKKYYSIAGMMVAVDDGTGLQYILTDHLGSTVAVTNASGTLTSQQRYLPFGEERAIPNSPILATDFGYTGQRLLDSGMGGIMDYKARFYSPALGRFIQPDSIIPRPSNPQSWNRYSYVLNRPINFNDPTGHESVCGYSYSDPECPQPTPAPLPTSPTDPLPGGGCNGIPDCGIPDTNDPVEIFNPDPLDEGLKQDDCKISCELELGTSSEGGLASSEVDSTSPCRSRLCDLEFILALADFLAAAYFTTLIIVAVVAVFASGAPIWAVAIGVVAWAAVGFVALNVTITGLQVVLSYIYPESNIKIDPLPLIPDEWHQRD